MRPDGWGKPMTRKEFERLRVLIESEEFVGDSSDPITYGIQRAEFDRNRLTRLIDAANQVRPQPVQTRVEQWKRQLARTTQSRARFEKIREEIHRMRPVFLAAQRRTRLAQEEEEEKLIQTAPK